MLFVMQTEVSRQSACGRVVPFSLILKYVKYVQVSLIPFKLNAFPCVV